MINSMLESIDKHPDLIAGFDMVQEEDFCPPVQDFVKQIMEAKGKSTNENFPVILHGN